MAYFLYCCNEEEKLSKNIYDKRSFLSQYIRKAHYDKDSADKDSADKVSADKEDNELPKEIQKFLDEGKLNINFWMSSEYLVLFGARDIEESVGEAIGDILDILEEGMKDNLKETVVNSTED
eukprot:12737879-Ditylum_brightwellii.AAC.1